MRKRTASCPVNPNAKTGFEKLHNPDSRDEALAALGQWVIDTCLFFGCRSELAFLVAAEFTKGLRLELNRSPAKRLEPPTILQNNDFVK